MRTIAFHNRKGGVGKTTLAGNIGHLSTIGGDTCLIDLDPQGNLSSWLITTDYRYELADHLLSDGKIPLTDVIISLGNRLHILPTSGKDPQLKNYAEVRLFQEPMVFANLVKTMESMGFSTLIFDLSPGMSQLERCAIMACDEVVIPVLGEYFAIDGVETAVQEIQRINRGFNKDVQYRRLVVNMVNLSFRRHLEALEGYRSLDFEMFTVPQDAKIAESQYRHQPLRDYSPSSKALPEMERLANSLMGGTNG